MDGQILSTGPPADPGSDITSTESFGGIDGYSEYVESNEYSPLSSNNMTDLAGYIRKMKMMHKVSEIEIDTIVQPSVLFSHTNELEIPMLANANTNLTKNLQDNGATTPVVTQTSLLHSYLEDTSVALHQPPSGPRVETRDAALQARARDLWMSAS